MIRTETIYLTKKDQSVFIKKSISIKGNYKEYRLSVCDFEGDHMFNEKVGTFKYIKDLDKIFNGVIYVYKNRGFE